MKEKRVKVTTTLRADLWKSLQIAAVATGRDANDILEDLLEAYIQRWRIESFTKSPNLTEIIQAAHAGRKSSKKGGRR